MGMVHSQDLVQGELPGVPPLELQRCLPFSVCTHSSQSIPLCMLVETGMIPSLDMLW